MTKLGSHYTFVDSCSKNMYDVIIVFILPNANKQLFILCYIKSVCSLSILTFLAFSSPRFLVPYFPFLHFHVLHFCATFSSLAFSSPAVLCRIFHSCIFQPCIFPCAAFSCLAFSVAPFLDIGNRSPTATNVVVLRSLVVVVGVPVVVLKLFRFSADRN